MGHVSLSTGAEVLRAAHCRVGGRAELAHELEEWVKLSLVGRPWSSWFPGSGDRFVPERKSWGVTTGAMLTET